MNILVTGARAPIAADIARVLASAGHRVFTTDSLRFPVGRFAPGIEGYIRMPAPRPDFRAFADAVNQFCVDNCIELVIPTSEEVFWLAQVPTWPAECRLLAPSAAVLEQMHNKGTFAQLANTLGIGVGTSHLLHSLAEATNFLSDHNPADFVFKPVFSRFATRVLVSPTDGEVRAQQFDSHNPWLAQPRAYGEEVCLYNVAHEGELLLHVAYRPRWRAGQGASIYFEPVEDASLRELSERVARATSFTGQMSFDVIQTATGPVAIECNPRGTSGVHLAAQASQEFARALLGGRAQVTGLAPRMLAVPLLMYHPRILASAGGRREWHAARDAMREAGVPIYAQLAATSELLLRSAGRGTDPLEAATADIEWNGSGTHTG
jgi:hypothetical protein